MSITLRTKALTTEAIVTDNGSLNLFYSTANLLQRDLKVKFTNKEDDIDSQEWDFKYKGHHLTLHYSVFNGISVSTSRLEQPSKDEKIVTALAELLREKLDTLPTARKIA